MTGRLDVVQTFRLVLLLIVLASLVLMRLKLRLSRQIVCTSGLQQSQDEQTIYLDPSISTEIMTDASVNFLLSLEFTVKF